jgi:hypothetical protein
MTISLSRIRPDLDSFNFQRLFIEHLGWNVLRARVPPLDVNGRRYHFVPVAQQGPVVLEVRCDDGGIAPRPDRLLIERYISALHREHLLIHVDGVRQASRWTWISRSTEGQRERWVEYHRGDRGDVLLQKLVGIAFAYDDLDDEGRISIVDVTTKMAKAFDVDKVTKGFFEKFRAEHDAFAAFLTGITEQTDRSWYISVMLNRLMFLYFIQKKQFLDSDPDYLQHRLQECQATGMDFYRDVLTVLFFKGLACEARERDDATNRLLGRIPYLNGGLFLPHALEQRYGSTIRIDHAAFVRLFRFFDSYSWHLDERPSRAGNEINPDVLGYIFEKYINQKQMGAYYTKEDITGYICRSTILPYVLQRCAVDVRAVIGADVTPYIYDAVATEARLPTETEREYLARRARFQQIRDDYAGGRIATVNDLITYNLDIEAFTEDWLLRLDDPVQLRFFYFEVLTKMSVLDPTCGSGAFLFAALNLLTPLYERALDRMREFIGAPDTAPATPAQKENVVKYLDFVDELESVKQHPNRRYFVLKRAIVDNLYGVDIMEEAVEICKLRLFLKLVAQVDEAERIEPLPDIDFNIRAGNTLVGFATRGEIEGRLFATPALKAEIAAVERHQRNFRALQTKLHIDAEILRAGKVGIMAQLDQLRVQLDQSLMEDYGRSDFDAFRASHRPFHWYVEFNSVMANGGFDVIVGNPPYVAKQHIEYDIPHSRYPDIYADVLFRIPQISSFRARCGMIVPLSITFSGDYASLRTVIASQGSSWFSSFDVRPATLFSDISQRCTIWLCSRECGEQILVTPMMRWRSEYRPYLVQRIAYTILPGTFDIKRGIPKLASSLQADVLRVLFGAVAAHANNPIIVRKSTHRLGFSQSARNFVSVYVEEPPSFDIRTLTIKISPQVGYLSICDEPSLMAGLAGVLGEMYLWYWLVIGDGFDVTVWMMSGYVNALRALPHHIVDLLCHMGQLLHARRNEALVFARNAGMFVGNYNHSKLRHLTRRSDLLLLAGLGLQKDHAIDILNYVAMVLSINAFAGEKSIPSDVKSQFPAHPIDETAQQRLISEIDRVLAHHYGFTDEELDFIINDNATSLMGANVEEGGADE